MNNKNLVWILVPLFFLCSIIVVKEYIMYSGLDKATRSAVDTTGKSVGDLRPGDFINIVGETYVVDAWEKAGSMILLGPGPSSSINFSRTNLHYGMPSQNLALVEHKVSVVPKGHLAYDATASWFWLQ